MTTEEVRNLLYDALAIFRHQRHLGAEHITGYHEVGDGMQLAFDDGTVATIGITVTPVPEGEAS